AARGDRAREHDDESTCPARSGHGILLRIGLAHGARRRTRGAMVRTARIHVQGRPTRALPWGLWGVREEDAIPVPPVDRCATLELVREEDAGCGALQRQPEGSGCRRARAPGEDPRLAAEDGAGR